MHPDELSDILELLRAPVSAEPSDSAPTMAPIIGAWSEPPLIEHLAPSESRVSVRIEGPTSLRARLDTPEPGLHRGELVAEPGRYRYAVSTSRGSAERSDIPSGAAELEVDREGLWVPVSWASQQAPGVELSVEPADIELTDSDHVEVQVRTVSPNGGTLVIETWPRPELRDLSGGEQVEVLSVTRSDLPYGGSGELRIRFLCESPYLNRRSASLRVPYRKTELYCDRPVLKLRQFESSMVSFWRSDGQLPELSWESVQEGIQLESDGTGQLRVSCSLPALPRTLCRVKERSGLAAWLEIYLPEEVLS